MRGGGGLGVGRRPGKYDDDDESLCWEIVRVLLIVLAILGAVVTAAYYLNQSLDAANTPSEVPSPTLEFDGPGPDE